MTDREKLIELLSDFTAWEKDMRPGENHYKALKLSPFMIKQLADYLISKEVTIPVRCGECVHAVPLDRNCELNSSIYMHCNQLRGELENNVWHKYKKYYKDYSLVDRDDFCSYGERIEDEI